MLEAEYYEDDIRVKQEEVRQEVFVHRFIPRIIQGFRIGRINKVDRQAPSDNMRW